MTVADWATIALAASLVLATCTLIRVMPHPPRYRRTGNPNR